MALYTGGMRQYQEARAAAARIAEQRKKAEAAESKRKGRSGLLGKIGGSLLGAAAVGLTGLTGGLAAPLIMGAASSLGKKWADEASKGDSPFGKMLKSPGQVGKIEAGGEFGYGQVEAAQATKALEESRKTEFGADTMLGDIAGSYLTAGMSGGLTGATKGLLKGDLSFGQALTTGSKDAWKFGGIEGMKESVLGLMPKGEEAVTDKEIVKQPFVESSKDYSSEYENFLQSGVSEDPNINPELDEEGWSLTGELGGRVPQLDQNTLLGLAILSEMGKQKKAYDDTPLEETQSSIAEIFISKGKTLGGNDIQSLSQKLGR